MNLFLFGLSKTETGDKTSPRVPKLGYFTGQMPKLSSRVILATSGADLVCHMTFRYKYYYVLIGSTTLKILLLFIDSVQIHFLGRKAEIPYPGPRGGGR